MNNKYKNKVLDSSGKQTKLYSVWRSMKNRCNNKNTKDYKNYGGRGINVCEEWLSNFDNFAEWCNNNGYKEGLQIDRVDNDKDYSPENCRFVTNRVNKLNKRVSGKINYRGVIKHKTLEKYIAMIFSDGKTIYIGTFDTPEKAAIAYDLKAIELRGNLANLNFKDKIYSK